MLSILLLVHLSKGQSLNGIQLDFLQQRFLICGYQKAGEQTSDRVLAYAVEITGIQGEKITGNLYELDYQQHYKHITELALPADNYMLVYEHGEREPPAARPFDASPDPQLGKFERFEAIPNDPEALQSLLWEERRSRGCFRCQEPVRSRV